jgi:hypothetical protein
MAAGMSAWGNRWGNRWGARWGAITEPALVQPNTLSFQPYLSAALKNWTGASKMPTSDYLKIGERLARRRGL